MATQAERAKLMESLSGVQCQNQSLIDECIPVSLIAAPEGQPSLFAVHILPWVLMEPKDRLNCMLVCKKWKHQTDTKAAWSRIDTLNVICGTEVERENGRPSIWPPEAQQQPQSGAINVRNCDKTKRRVEIDGHVLGLLQRCAHAVRTINIKIFDHDQIDTLFVINGAKTLIGCVDDGELRLPKLTLVTCAFVFDPLGMPFDSKTSGLPFVLQRVDELLSTTFSTAHLIGLCFGDDLCSFHEDEECPNTDGALDTLIAHHGNRLHILDVGSRWEFNGETKLLSSCIKGSVRSLCVFKGGTITLETNGLLRPITWEMNELLHQQTAGTLEVLQMCQIGPLWLWRNIHPDVTKNLLSLQFEFGNPMDFNVNQVLLELCPMIAEKCPKLVVLNLRFYGPSREWQLSNFPTIVRQFTLESPERTKFSLDIVNITPFASKSHVVLSRTLYEQMSADHMAAALHAEFAAYEFNGVVEKTIDECRGTVLVQFKFKIGQCEFVFSTN